MKGNIITSMIYMSTQILFFIAYNNTGMHV